jgi:hypothetical protein
MGTFLRVLRWERCGPFQEQSLRKTTYPSEIVIRQQARNRNLEPELLCGNHPTGI